MAKSVVPPTRSLSVHVRTAKSRSPASARWLARQLNDPYVAAARQQGWRSRAAFKLLELDDRFHLLRKGARVVDLGAAPGGWTQVAVKRGAGIVLGLDLLPMDPIQGAELVQGDFNDPDMPGRLADRLGGKADLVLSDMAPNTTGHAATDHLRIMGLTEMALDFASQVLTEGGAFVASSRQRIPAAFHRLRHASPRQPRCRSRSPTTASNIAVVSRPVFVFRR